MKERLFFDDEFEKQLKEKADQFKMYPSDKVWNSVYSSLHTRRRRFVAGMAFLIGGILILAGSQLLSPVKNTISQTAAIQTTSPAKPVAEADLHSFTTVNLTPVTANISRGMRGSDAGLTTTTSFVQRYEESLSQKFETRVTLNAVPEKMQSGTNIKASQPQGLNASDKTDETASAKDNAESSVMASSTVPAERAYSDDLTTGKSVTQLNHLRNDRFRWEIYIAPTLNTHYLNGINYQTISQSVRNAPVMVVHVANVNGFVDNTPAIGYAVGGNLIYRISKNISLKAGLEFSFNRYYIKVYNASRNASASLNSYLGYVADSLVNPFSPDISASKNPQHYQNKYYQLSMPVGLEIKVAGKGRLQLHLGANLQPTYLLNTDAYVLSGDYSRYTQDAQAFRRWNLIAGAEAFLSYGSGKLRWELGPQVRYQIFSTYKNSNPLQENMLNYGIRIGISKTIR